MSTHWKSSCLPQRFFTFRRGQQPWVKMSTYLVKIEESLEIQFYRIYSNRYLKYVNTITIKFLISTPFWTVFFFNKPEKNHKIRTKKEFGLNNYSSPDGQESWGLAKVDAKKQKAMNSFIFKQRLKKQKCRVTGLVVGIFQTTFHNPKKRIDFDYVFLSVFNRVCSKMF